MTSRTILVVDDEPMVLSFMAEALRRASYAVLEAADAEAGWELAVQHPGFDALVTDVRLPGISGPELARRLRGVRPDLPVLYVTGYAGSILIDGSGDHGHCLQKPFRTKDFVASVSNLFD